MLTQQLVNALVLGSIYSLFALGLTLAWGTLDVLNLAHGAVFVFSGYAAAKIAADVALPFPVLVVVAMLVGGLLTVAIELIAFRPIRNGGMSKRQAELSMLVASVGAGIILDRFVDAGSGGTAFGLPAGTFDVETYQVADGLRISNIQIVIVVSVVVCGLALDWWIRRSRQGRAVRAIAHDPLTSSLLGINVNALAAATVFVSGLLAGLAGLLLLVSTSGVDSQVGHNLLLKGFAVLIVGGVGSVRGGLIAAFIVALSETLLVAYGPPGLADAVAFALIIVVLLARPEGLVPRGKVQRA